MVSGGRVTCNVSVSGGKVTWTTSFRVSGGKVTWTICVSFIVSGGSV